MDRKILEQRGRAFEHVFDAIVVTDLDGIIIDWNVGAEKLYGYTREEAVGQSVAILHVADDPDRTAEVLQAVDKEGKWTGEIQMAHKNGSIGWIESVVVPLLDDHGNHCGALGINRDISLRVRTKEELIRLATTDDLTGLPNRALLLDRLNGALLRAERQHRCLALLFIDLDDFKDINDCGGHLLGDQTLTEIAHDLAAVVRECDTVARIGGDEFAVLLEDCSGVNKAREVSGKILKAIKRTLVIGDRSYRITASIGIAVYPSDGDNVSALLGHADASMYRAKEMGGNWFR